MKLIIVESPTKANTFNKFLKKGKGEFQVEASYGHIRDLPASKLSIDIEHDFKPNYQIMPDKKVVTDRIKALAKKADEVILATDADREGEAISYHIAYILGYIDEKWPNSKIKKDVKIKRIVFHEITEEALQEALKEPSELNINVVDSQQARRILDRIVGYKLSPLLWGKLGKRWLSAGRVQTVAVRFIVEREKEIAAFAKDEFYRISGIFKNGEDIKAKLVSKNDEKFEKSFSLDLFDGKYSYTKTTIDKSNVANIKSDLENGTYKISDLSKNQSKRYPAPPLTTSTLQQEASKLFGYTSKSTMKLAQDLYERGVITYHRTDSLNLSPKFTAAAATYIEKSFGKQYIPTTPRVYKNKNKGAQEAHEAIRPTKLDPNPDIEQLTPKHKKVYDLIFRKALASQMSEAEINTIKVKILSDKNYLFESSWEEVIFDGFLKLYSDKAKAELRVKEPGVNEIVELKTLDVAESESQPPPRYNEASLIKTLEERGIGRPSTYAPTISTIQDKRYVERREGRFYPSALGTAICDYLVKAFPKMFDIDFTAKMEDDLDLIADGKETIVQLLTNFYTPFEKELKKESNIKTYINVEEKTDEICPNCGKPMMVRFSKYGKFLGCSGYPECKTLKPFLEKTGKKCPECAGDIIVRYSKAKKRFYGCSNYPNCKFMVWYLNQVPEIKPDGTKVEKVEKVEEGVKEEKSKGVNEEVVTI